MMIVNNNTVYGEDSLIKDDMDIVVKKSTKIVIELESVDESEVNESEVISVISNLTGISEDKIVIKIDTDEDGKVISIINHSLC